MAIDVICDESGHILANGFETKFLAFLQNISPVQLSAWVYIYNRLINTFKILRLGWLWDNKSQVLVSGVISVAIR